MFRMGGRTLPPYPLHRVFAEGAWRRRWNRGASFSSGSSQISDASYADTDASMSELASSDARLTSELPPNLQMHPMSPVWDAR